MTVDVNVYLSRWPCRRLPYDETGQLVTKLGSAGVKQAWVSSFDALLHKDIAGVNERIASECARHGEGMLLPFGSVNPTLPDWQEDLRRCRQTHGMPGIRLHPGYHGYRLDDDRFAELLSLAEQSRQIVQLALKMEDERTQHPLLRVATVDVRPLIDQLADRSALRVVILNGMRDLTPDMLERLADAGNVYFELSMLEGVGGVARLLATVPLERILFGSYFPFFYLESAQLKLRESELANFQRMAITEQNAARLLAE